MSAAPTNEMLHELLEPVVAAAGLELDSVLEMNQYGATVVRVTVEAPEGAPGVDSDTLAQVSRALSAAMDEADPIDGEYTLEVSTPGIERELRRPAHWRRNRGRLVAGRLRDGQRFEGRVLDADEDAVTLDVDGTATTIKYDTVKKARARVEFTTDFETQE